MSRVGLICGLVLAGLLAARAHEPYQITSVAYLYSNRTDLVMEMEFPTAMTLAGVKFSRETSPADQFTADGAQLRDAAGGFFQFDAGNDRVAPLHTNVELVAENHIRFQVQFAPTDVRPLRFTAPGLRALAQLGPYGAALTVLDLVHQKVVGQSTLFADSPAAEFSPLAAATNPPKSAAPPRGPESNSPALQPATKSTGETSLARPARGRVVSLVLAGGLLLVGVAWWLVRRSEA